MTSINKRKYLKKEKLQPKQLENITAEIAPAATVEMARKVLITTWLEHDIELFYTTKEGNRTLNIQIGGNQPEGWISMGKFPFGSQVIITIKNNIIF